MKNCIRVILVAFMAMSLWRCADQQPENALPRDVQFSVRTSAASSKSGRSADLPPGTQLMISIDNSTGDAVLTSKRIELLLIGDQYVSKAFKLAPGTYTVTDFALVNGSEVIYATPHAGSPLAGQVAKPLPYSFTVSTDELQTLDAEVLPTHGASPEDFGYAAFDISGIDGRKIPLTVITIDQTGQHLADHAEVLIIEVPRIPITPDTLAHYVLETGNGEVPFDLDPARQYTLVVARHGFRKYIRNFYFSELEADFSGGSLEITLDHPAFTYKTALTTSTSIDFETDIDDSGTLLVDFNEYIVGPETVKIDPVFGEFQHNYSDPGTYFVTVEGDLNFIQHLTSIPNVTSMDVTHLSELKSLSIFSNQITELDLSQNHKFQGLNADNSPLSKVTISRRAPIVEVIVSRSPAFTTQTISALIDDVYAAVIYNDSHGGLFYYFDSATPTPAAISKLKEMEQRGWTVMPGTMDN